MNILHIIFCFINRILFSETLYVMKTLYTFSATIAYILKSQKFLLLFPIKIKNVTCCPLFPM